MQIYDITIPVKSDMLVWPKDPSPRIESIQSLEKDGNATSLLHMSSHTGTHIDAPNHFVMNAVGVDQIPLDACIGPCQVIEVCMGGGEISVEDLRGKILRVSQTQGSERILLRTKNSAQKLLHQKTFREDFVGLTVEAADFLIQHGVRLIGVDYLSCERGPSEFKTDVDEKFPVHKKLLKKGIVMVESCDLSEVEPGEYNLIVLSLRLKNLDGSPCRAILTT